MIVLLQLSCARDPLPLNLSSEDTVKTLREESWLALRSIHADFPQDFALVWAGQVLIDPSVTLSILQIENNMVVHAVKPPTSFLPDVYDIQVWLPKIFNIQHHCDPRADQHNGFDSLELFSSFCEWASSEEGRENWTPNQDKWKTVIKSVRELASIEEPTSSDNRHVKFFGAYGCALVSTVRNANEMVNLVLICLDGWELRVQNGESKRFHTAQAKPKKSKKLYVGLVSASDFNRFLSLTQDFLTKGAQRKGTKRSAASNLQGHQKTSDFVRAVMTDALEVIEKEEEKPEGNTPPTGGFTDVGLHTGGKHRDTSWPLVQAVLWDVINGDIILHEALCEFYLSLVECQVAQCRSDFSNGRCMYELRVSLDKTKQALKETALKACETDASLNYRFEARCAMVDRTILEIQSDAARKHGRKFKLKRFTKSDFDIHLHSLSPPDLREPRNVCLSHGDRLKLAERNLDVIPIPFSASLSSSGTGGDASGETPFNSDTVIHLVEWLKHPGVTSLCEAGGDRRNEAALLICRNVERVIFTMVTKDMESDKVEGQDVGTLCNNMQQIIDMYRSMAKVIQKGGLSISAVESESRELLLVWSSFCLVHFTVLCHHPTVGKYTPALKPTNLEHLVLCDKLAVDALGSVAAYLARYSGHGYIFSLRANDKTIEFARDFSRQRFYDRWLDETAKSEERVDNHWQEVECKKERLRDLDLTLSKHQATLREWKQKLGRTEKPRRCRWNSTTPENDRQHGEAKRQVRAFEDYIRDTKRDIMKAEQSPAPVIQPLPKDEDSALPVIFFLFMPLEFQVLSRLSFLSQQLLLPSDRSICMYRVTSLGNKELDVASLVAVNEPNTQLRLHYMKFSGNDVVDSDVQLGSFRHASPGLGWPPACVRDYNDKEQGVWHPDSLTPVLFWCGGKCDPRSETKFFNPFVDIPDEALAWRFTEKLRTADQGMQWTMSQLGDKASSCRGSWPEAAQDSLDLPNSDKFGRLSFGLIRAYPNQQLRRFCSVLKGRQIPLSEGAVRTLLLQTLYHVGPLDDVGERQWRFDLKDLDGWPTLGQELRDYGEEIHTKPREHEALLTLGLIAAHASEWDEGCQEVSRVIAGIAKDWAKVLSEEIRRSDPTCIPEMRARCCLFYMYSILCYGGILARQDVADICELVVQAKGCRFSEERTSLDTLVLTVTSHTQEFMARHLSQLLELLDHGMLTKATNVALGTNHSNLCWQSTPHSTCFSSTIGTGQLISLNIFNGTVLLDGRPPRRLPSSLTLSEMYRRTFENRDFDVIDDSGVLTTTRDVLEKRYKFFETSSMEIVIQEINTKQSEQLELLDGTADGVNLWGQSLPKRLKHLYSHWYSRENNVILLRPLGFQDREVYFFMCKSTLPKTGWHCRCVPSHLRSASLETLMELQEDFDDLVCITETKVTTNLFRVMRHFEHDNGLIHTALTGKGQLVLELPRFGIEFELSQGNGDLLSRNFRSYHLSRHQQLTDTLYGFDDYLILESPSKPKLLLVPAGPIRTEGQRPKVQMEGSSESEMGFHTYEVHPRFHSIDVSGGKNAVEGRLQLAVLHAATGSSILEARCNRTGGERAVELIRRCFVNRPMSPTELCHLQALKTLGGYMASVPLLCYELELSSKELHFLYGRNLESTDLDVRFDREAADEYSELKEHRHLSWRGFMRKEEEERILCRTILPGPVILPEAMPLHDCKHESLLTGIQRVVQQLRSMVTSKRSRRKSEVIPLVLHDVSSSVIGEEIKMGLHLSWTKHVEQPVMVANRQTEQQLEKLHGSCESMRQDVEARLLGALSRLPSQKSILWVRTSLRRLAGIEPIVDRLDLCRCAIAKDTLMRLNPSVSSEAMEYLHTKVLCWLQLCVLEDKLERMIAFSQDNSRIQLEKELENIGRVWSVHEFPAWLVFEVEQRLQIRQLQYDVARFCIKNPGKITQLNMGEGKTRVILPMLLLHFSQAHSATRVHFLSPLLGEAFDYLHSTLTASFHSMRFFLLPFHRGVTLNLQGARAMLAVVRRCQEVGGALIIAPEHRLSLHLKRLEDGTPSEVRDCLKLVENQRYMDLFDESDEILHHKYQLIYAVGGCIPLPAAGCRWTVAQAVLHALQCDDRVQLILAESGAILDRAETDYGGGFDPLRLIPGRALDRVRNILLCAIADKVLNDPPYHMRWIKNHPLRGHIKEFVVDPRRSLEWFRSHCRDPLNSPAHDQVLALRGLLAGDIMEHCVYRRFRVDYGIDRRRGMKRRIAVPYRSCDNPAERAEYAHPDVIIVLTLLSYYYDGLALSETKEAIQALLSGGPNVQEKEYSLWLERARHFLDDGELFEIDNVNKLDPTNALQLRHLHQVFRHNMAMINFWLANCVFPTETMQFPERLSANACHLADNSGECCGFSGTKDNYLLLPPQVEQQIPVNGTLAATDGKMLDLLLRSEEVVHIPPSKCVREKVLELAVRHKSNAIIDVGASMAGLSNSQVADRLIQLLLDDVRSAGRGHQGVVYFDSAEDTWMVKGLRGRIWPLGSSPIKESEAIVFFDESRCRGADMKLLENANAVLTLSLGMCKDKLMQAAGRMRKLEHGQSLTFVVPDEVAMKLCDDEGNSKLSTKSILEWVLKNTVENIANSLPEWATQTSYFATTNKDAKARYVDEVLAVDDLYGGAIGSATVSSFVESITRRDVARVEEMGIKQDAKSLGWLQRIQEYGSHYGSDQSMSLSQNNEECERELENERELEKEVEMEIPVGRPRGSTTWNFGTVFTASRPTVLPSEAGVSRLSKTMTARFPSTRLSEIQWDERIYVTKNFVETVLPTNGGRLGDLSEYVRPVDFIVLFRSRGRSTESSSCLLLSEWEADRVLPIAQQYCRSKRNEKLNVLVNFAYLLEAADQGWESPIRLQIPPAPGKQCLKVSDEIMVGLQLFAGDTTYRTEGRKRALCDLLSGREAKRAAHEMVSVRGRGNFIARSDLEEVCELDMLESV